MTTKAVESRWRALEDALGRPRDEGMHLSCKLNCASGPCQGLVQFIGSAWRHHLNTSRTESNLNDQAMNMHIESVTWDQEKKRATLKNIGGFLFSVE